MLVFAAGLIVGIALGVVFLGFLAVAAYDRGFDDALERRAPWRAELKARRAFAMRRFTERRAS
jgi:hypothetical protein